MIGGKKYLIPPPKLCPDCREQRRTCFRNERKLYERKCDFSGQEIISTYSPDKPYKVYEKDIWWSDAWDPLSYGRDFDFSQPFFEQFYALSIDVPKIALMVDTSENCRHTNFVLDCKNCYMVLGWGRHCQDCYYGRVLESCKNCVDVSFTFNSELCYECVNVDSAYHCTYATSCINCSDCHFCENCIGCKNCFGCVNLTNHEEFYIFNKPYNKEEYFQKVKELQTYSSESMKLINNKLDELKTKTPQKYYHGSNIENSTGDYIRSTQNVHHGFDIAASQDLRYVNDGYAIKDGIDACKSSNAELFRECISFTGQRSTFVNLSWHCHDLLYCQECFNNCSDCFGCIGLKHKQYCILNKQYTKEQYEDLVPKIIAHMEKTREWGEFFPIQHAL